MRRKKGRKASFFTRIGREIGELLAKYNRRNGSLLAKGLGFSFIMGLIPMLFLTVALAGYTYKLAPQWRGVVGSISTAISNELLTFFPEGAGRDLLSHVETAAQNWGAIGILGVIIMIGIALALFDSIERSFATMLSAPRRKFHFGRLISLALMMGMLVLFFAASILSTMASYFSRAFAISNTLVYWGGKVLSWLIFSFILLGLYYLFARRRLRFWPTILIALIASLLWQLLGIAGSSLIRYAGRRVIVYGALAWVTVFLIYMRILAELLLFSSLLVSRASPPVDDV